MRSAGGVSSTALDAVSSVRRLDRSAVVRTIRVARVQRGGECGGPAAVGCGSGLRWCDAARTGRSARARSRSDRRSHASARITVAVAAAVERQPCDREREEPTRPQGKDCGEMNRVQKNACAQRRSLSKQRSWPMPAAASHGWKGPPTALARYTLAGHSSEPDRPGSLRVRGRLRCRLCRSVRSPSASASRAAFGRATGRGRHRPWRA